MVSPHPGASALFLREAEVRRGIELMHFGQTLLGRAVEPVLAVEGLGRAHQRALYFIARRPDLSVSDLLRLLAITKQSLGRVLGDLETRGLVEMRQGRNDRRQRLLRLTADGQALETRLFEAMRARLAAAYAEAGQDAVTGFWRVLEGLIPEAERARLVTP
ncbi:MAG: MarR family transcriptional regulator [Sphingomonas sanxanigenens]|uniref:MarR family transcriptional regulator n=1 Tax=Sphingomonas sanxanigenens TaxID=397260 RepID=A0A2W5ACC5_9SPHN|nr:MAG: MarR family transcriptional regulator [Sphingomonas sanxanigenens]